MTMMKFLAPPRAWTNAGMIADRLGDFLAAVDQVHDAGRQFALLQEFEDALLRQRHLLGWLEDERVAAGHRERQEP
jgi:hypothetical protein